ncbi:hypothetical protein B5807_11474 [Epicoccum nigrum]|uniref:Uncharacterized protein n=1 Tax=Epicoccum nigrum TaxID=105696 RepID=A0A1Y2LIB0_EPING|nr:hypothetical protein B5807_11474 [Epicoccum nigrum]
MFMLALVSALLVAKTIQQSGRDPTQDVCRRHKHLTCVVDSKLYLYGGIAYYGSGMNVSTLQTNTYLLWEDLTKAEGTEYSFPVQYSNGSIVSNMQKYHSNSF